MQFQALVSDYDGTLAEHGRVSPNTMQALYGARDGGLRLILATGRQLDDLIRVFPEHQVFDRLVVENGAVVFNPETREVRDLAQGPPPAFVQRLTDDGVQPLGVGRVIVATSEPHQETVLRAIRGLGLELQVIFNKGAVMVLPSGINKVTGARAALRSLGLSRHNAVAVGDAENDHALLLDCEVGVAVNDAVSMLKERADWVTRGAGAEGVRELIERLVHSNLSHPWQRITRHDVPIGHDASGQLVRISPQGTCLLVCGTSGGGKSTLISAFIEQLSERGYQVCVVDPEGDFPTPPGSVTIGGAGHPPTLEEAVQTISASFQSVVINLLEVPLLERARFATGLLNRLRSQYHRYGRPHWLICDESHHMFDRDGSAPQTPALGEVAGSLMLAVVRPERLPVDLLSQVTHVAAVGTAPAQMARDFAAAIGAEVPALTAPDKQEHSAILWVRNGPPTLLAFESTRPRGKRRRHLRKYAAGELGPDKCFYFTGPNLALKLRAKNLTVFIELAYGVDDETWTYHLRRQDYSRWLRDSIKDLELAAELYRIEQRSNLSARASREKVRRAIETRYTLPI